MPFRFDLLARVALRGSGEYGAVRSRAEHAASGPTYLVRYVAGDGRLVESWWDEDALEPDLGAE